jgi:hypothetical protein
VAANGEIFISVWLSINGSYTTLASIKFSRRQIKSKTWLKK